MASTDTRQFWERATAGLQWRVNLAAWLDLFAPAFFALGTAAALVLFALRRTGRPEIYAAWLLAAGAVVLALVAWWRARGRFFRRLDARIFLEHQLRLDSSLSAATEGIAAWPVVPRETPALLRWRASAPLGWVTGALALWVAAQFLPVPAADPARPAEKPPALAQVEQLLGELATRELATPESVDPLAEQARELAARSLEQQYTHGGLEAADALRDQAMNAVDQLARNLEAASSRWRRWNPPRVVCQTSRSAAPPSNSAPPSKACVTAVSSPMKISSPNSTPPAAANSAACRPSNLRVCANPSKMPPPSFSGCFNNTVAAVASRIRTGLVTGKAKARAPARAASNAAAVTPRSLSRRTVRPSSKARSRQAAHS